LPLRLEKVQGVKIRLLCLAVGLLFIASFVVWDVAAAEDCSTCGQPGFPEASSFLSEKGYSAADYKVLMSWQEAAPRGAGGVATGYHVLPKGGGEAFDLYSDAAGNLLGSGELEDLGIRGKRWDLPPIEQQSEIPAELEKSLPVRPVAVGPGKGMKAAGFIALPLVDLDALLEEDAQADGTPRKGPQRTGIVRALPETIVVDSPEGLSPSSGWQTLDDGSRLWSVTLQSPEARAIRVHFTALRLPPGGEVIVYNTGNPSEAYGPYVRPYGSDADLWSASCFSDTVTVECHLPTDSDVTKLEIVIDSVVHTYVDFGLLEWTKAAGACNNDVTCYPDWASTARGVGGFTLIINPNQLHCTGTLLADTDPTSTIPYFLTAYHCFDGQVPSVAASGMEFFWLYQTSTCDGTPPSLMSVPRTSGGADFLAGVSVSAGSDFVLLRMRSTPPQGLTYVGWSTEPVSVGTEVAAIHHPRGEYKRISFGHTTDTGSDGTGEPVQPYSRFLEVLWDEGTTEKGSSGSPLLLVGTQVIVGQLWGGNASCTSVEEPDYFGRFDQTFPVIEQWLAPVFSFTDIDRSGTVDSVDIQLVINAALGIPISYNADVDSSGVVDAVDVQLVILAVLKQTG